MSIIKKNLNLNSKGKNNMYLDFVTLIYLMIFVTAKERLSVSQG